MSTVTRPSSPRRFRLASKAVGLLRSQPGTAVGLAILLIAALAALFAPVIAPYGIDEQVGDSFAAPSSAHPLGLDDGGIDMLSLIIWGARTSMLIGLSAAAVAVAVGGLVGLLSGYFGGWIDTVLMRITDYFLVVPILPLMIVVAAVWGSSTFHISLVIGLLGWAPTARVIRAQTMSLRERMFVQRARSQGATNRRIVGRHVLPHLAPLLAAYASIAVADAVFAETGLTFLGLGPQDGTSWGTLIANAFGRAAVSHGAWWAIVPPGACVAIVVLGCSLVGRGIEDALNPRLKAGHLASRTFRLRPLVGREKGAV